ncbi:MAG TPA: hypothetical protein VGG19_01870, partial [Tepidisphaeraceae bacterium]
MCRRCWLHRWPAEYLYIALPKGLRSAPKTIAVSQASPRLSLQSTGSSVCASFQNPLGFRVQNCLARTACRANHCTIDKPTPMTPTPTPQQFFQFGSISSDWGTWRHILENLFMHVVAFFLIGYSMLPLLRKVIKIPDVIVPLATLAIFSVFAYIAFYIFLFNHLVGEGAVRAIYLLGFFSMLHHFFRYRGKVWKIFGGMDALCVWILVGLATLSYLCIVYSTHTKMEYTVLAARRLEAWSLPSDNALNLMAADLMIGGYNARIIANEWQNSDRPPLQTGVEMLCAFRGRIGGDKGLAFAMPLAAVLFQASWLCGAWAVLRFLGLSVRQSVWVCLALIPTGFLWLNTIYVWPKLSAAAFCLGAFALLLLKPTRSPGTVLLAFLFITLAMLSHAGVIFFLLPMGLMLLFPRFWPGWKAIWPAVLVAAIVYSPWIWYQKFYDPPGDRLIKWHLAGIVQKDPRTPMQAIRDSYRQAGWSTVIQNKGQNFATIFKGGWSSLFQFNKNAIDADRNDEFFYLFRSIGILNLGWITLLISLFYKPLAAWRRHLVICLAVVIASIIIWCLLMFGPAATIIHQGPYPSFLVIYLLLLTSMLLISKKMFLFVSLSN